MTMTDRSLDELGPVDYLIVEFPAGQQNFTGEGRGRAPSAPRRRHHPDHGHRHPPEGHDGTVMAQELGDLEELGELAADRDRARPDAGRGGRRTTSRRPWTRAASPACWCTRTCGPRRSPRPCAVPVASSSPTAGSPSRPSSPPSRPTRPSKRKEPDMPLGPGRAGRGVIGAPVAKAAVVTAAVVSPDPRPSPRRPSWVRPSHPARRPIAKTAVVAAAVTPGRRRF